MLTIRNYRPTDFSAIASWWTDRGDMAPHPGMLVEDGTFVLENDGEPAASQTILCTQSKDICILEFFCKNPKPVHPVPRGFEQVLWKHCFAWAKVRGYKYVVGYSKVERIFPRLEAAGMTRSLGGLQSFFKEL